ncbi:hypothetical protein [Pseudovibrio sp. Ad37]|uniref:hypothetical protein n=1 Tax=Pseudovibrio sp. Ad37 TaxID=989422 RepID=UPI0007AED0EF|nr:hypothetical protein [Pseudovibrio sp. Ad37]KZL19050.1 hypothetical protein PsAD37_03741 [Pseudovibrio sp. Ad37]
MSAALVRQLETLEVWFREYTRRGEAFSQHSADAFGAGLKCAIETAKASQQTPAKSALQIQKLLLDLKGLIS